MSVSSAYLAVVLIWSTTPLGIIFSSETVHPTLAVLLRMVIALVVGMMVIRLAKVKLLWHLTALKLYLYSSIGVFGGMSLSYLASDYISSGMMSLAFGLSPVLSGLLAQKILKESSFGWTKRFAMVVSVIGLAIVCFDNLTLKDQGYIGLILVFTAVSLFSFSGVLVKSVAINIHPLATTVGTLTVSLPCFLLLWLAFGAEVAVEQWSEKSLWAIIYLGIFGSLIGFLAYFYVLQKLPAATVALITMITPIIALVLGAVFNHEAISFNVIIGASLVMLGLWIYHFGQKTMIKYRLLARV